MVTIWCEWDIGHEGCVFSSIEKARAWCEANESLKGVFDEDMKCLQDVEDAGLIGFEPVQLDP